MLEVQYAAPNSAGVLAHKIGWVDFGNSLSLVNGSTNVRVMNKIPGGYYISFLVSLTVTGNPSVIPEINYRGFMTPTFGAAPFGTVAYTGILGNVALYTGINPTIGNIMNITITLNQIEVTDCSGKPVEDYTIYVADAETTNQGQTSAPEIWTVTSNGTVWDLVQQIPSVSGNTTAGPVVSGLQTLTVVETGEKSSASETSANVFSSKNPTKLIATAQVDGGREGFCFGIIVNEITNKRLHVPCHEVINKVEVGESVRYYYNPPIYNELQGIIYNGKVYKYEDLPVTVTGQIGTYTINKKSIQLEAKEPLCSDLIDTFLIEVDKCNQILELPVVFVS